jgi:xanthine dehydrogenase accessory factor
MGVWSRILEGLDRHGRTAMVTVAGTKGSAPREAGARMVVHPDGAFSGTIGGGTLEWRAIAMAQALLAKERAKGAEIRNFTLGPDMGQCCGGRVDLLFERFDAGRRAEVAGLAEREAIAPFVTRGRIDVNGVSRRVVEDASVPAGEAIMAGDVLTEGFGEERRPVMLFGAGHVGRALVLAMAPLPFKVTWYDPRPDAFPSHVPGNCDVRRLDDPEAVFAAAEPGGFVLIMTHSHQLDMALTAAALSDGRLGYVGLIGSKSKRARFEARLREAGLDEARIASLVCPIGIDGIDSKAPAVIAAATVAEVLIVDQALRQAARPAETPVRKRAGG